jgi:catechol 2,3-dioxygenase-like lactoylglutathione lyase family enzyme
MTLTSSIPVLRVADYPAARAFWLETMGFTLGEEGGTPPRFGTFHSDAATVFVDGWHGPDAEQHAGWRAYFHCDDVDILAASVTASGYPFEGPRNTVYGMRELTLRDPAGNLLCFGQHLPTPE